MDLSHLSDHELLSNLTAFVASERQLLTKVVASLVEVEERRLHLVSACASLYDFCKRRLGMSEGQACRRIAAARLVKRFPTILGCIERGEIILSNLVLLRDHLAEENFDDLLDAAKGKTKREVQLLLAARFSAARPAIADAPNANANGARHPGARSAAALATLCSAD